MTRTPRQIELRIQRIKDEIVSLDEIQPGSLSRQYNVCGNPQCACKATPPRKHGPYYQVSFTWRGKHSTRFVGKDTLARTRRRLENYQRLRTLTDEWIELTMELAKLDKLARSA
jgi:hypothetical protein